MKPKLSNALYVPAANAAASVSDLKYTSIGQHATWPCEAGSFIVNGLEAAEPCLNGGVCVNSEDYTSFSCQCADTFTGSNCEAELVCSANDPCLNEAVCSDVLTTNENGYSAFGFSRMSTGF